MNTLVIILSTGTRVEVKDPACLLGLTKEEFEELKQIFKQSEAA